MRFLSSFSVLTLALTGCGGGSESSSPPPITITPPSPSPTPTPAPPPTSPAVAFRASMAGPLVGTVFFDTNGSGILGDTNAIGSDLITTTNRAGDFGRDAIGRLTATEPPATISSTARVSGMSALTGFGYSDVRAPLQASVFSPATSLIGITSDDFVPRNSGLSLSAQELVNFDAYSALSSGDIATQSKARSVTAFNLKLLAHAGYETTGVSSPTDVISVGGNLRSVREQLAVGAVDFNSSSSLINILNRSQTATFTDTDGRRAAAHLLARYGEAVDIYLTNSSSIVDIEYGLRLVVLPELRALFRANTSPSTRINRILSITTDDMVSTFANFRSVPTVDVTTAPFVAVADWRSMPLGGVSTAFYPAGCNAGELVCNDRNIDVGVGSDGLARVVAVRVPPAFAAQLAVTLAADGSVSVVKSGTQRALVYFEYDARSSSGFLSTSRAYILLNGDI